jgi:thioredoxin 1
MRSFRIARVLPLVMAGLIVISSCNKKGDASKNDKKVTQNTTSVKTAEGTQVTFVELGSVNCIPCRMMQPVMKEIDSIYAGKVKVVFIDVLTDEGKPYAQQFGIRAIPTQVFLDAQGKELARHIGFYPKDSIVALLASKGLK